MGHQARENLRRFGAKTTEPTFVSSSQSVEAIVRVAREHGMLNPREIDEEKDIQVLEALDTYMRRVFGEQVVITRSHASRRLEVQSLYHQHAYFMQYEVRNISGHLIREDGEEKQLTCVEVAQLIDIDEAKAQYFEYHKQQQNDPQRIDQRFFFAKTTWYLRRITEGTYDAATDTWTITIQVVPVVEKSLPFGFTPPPKVEVDNVDDEDI